MDVAGLEQYPMLQGCDHGLVISGGECASDHEVGDVLREEVVRVPQVPEPYSQIELRAVARGQLIRSRLMVGVGEVGFGLGLWHLACVQERVRERYVAFSGNA